MVSYSRCLGLRGGPLQTLGRNTSPRAAGGEPWAAVRPVLRHAAPLALACSCAADGRAPAPALASMDSRNRADVMALTAAAAGISAVSAARRMRRIRAELCLGAAASSSGGSSSNRGCSLISSHFLLENGSTLLNHGSYGALPQEVSARQHELILQMEANPDTWFRRAFRPLWDQAVTAAADLAGAERSQDVVFVKNATAGVNAVVNTLQLGAGDACLVTTQTYGACANAVSHACERSGATLLRLEVSRRTLSDHDALEAQLLAELDGAAKVGLTVRFALVDHVTSPTAVVLPVRRLCAACRARQVPVMVDGAHAPGNVLPLNIPALGCDWYTGNLHKWVFCPKGCAFLWVDPARQDDAQATIISHAYKSPFQERFAMQGTLDDTAFLCLPFALGWVDRQLGGLAAVAQHNHELVCRGAQLLVKSW
jgi:isopenicillin-N epimerase